MSTIAFQNVKIKSNLNLNTAGSITTSGIDMTLAAASNKDIRLVGSGTGSIKSVFGGLSKTLFIGSKVVAIGSGMSSANLFQIVLPANTFGGLKINIVLTNSGNQITRSEEYTANVRYASSDYAVSLYQLACVPTSSADTSAVMVAESTSLTAAAPSGGEGAPLLVPISYALSVTGTSPGTITASYFAEWCGGSGASFVGL